MLAAQDCLSLLCLELSSVVSRSIHAAILQTHTQLMSLSLCMLCVQLLPFS
ncbi:hypothetical protein SKA58_06595 [Sphingomonas sp. SKA58]|nr:hypothetical protein SKA58_06595 [Sphingomonas sp. SKA58]